MKTTNNILKSKFFTKRKTRTKPIIQKINTLLYFIFVGTLFLNAYTIKAQQCNPVGFTSQEVLNDFPINNPDCTEITGNLTIGASGSNLTDLSPLSNITSVDGYLRISSNSNLQSLSGLDNLTTVSGDLIISDNPLLENFSPIANLTSIGGNLIIEDNFNLVNFLAFTNLTSISGDIIIRGHRNLIDLSGLENITSIGGNLIIDSNFELIDISLSSLTSVGGDVLIEQNYKLANISSLANLTSIENNLTIRGSSDLENLSGLSNLTSVYELIIDSNGSLTTLNGLFKQGVTMDINRIEIRGNSNLVDMSALANINLSNNLNELQIVNNFNLTTIHIPNEIDAISRTEINRNSSLINLSGLDNIRNFSNRLEIIDNNSLTSLNGLNSIEEIDRLVLEDNDVLEDINALASLPPFSGGISIQRNPLLTNCAISSVCLTLNTSATAEISDNGTWCESVETVNTACATLDSDQDSVVDINDNCPLTPNTEQADADNDGIGNFCDADYCPENVLLFSQEDVDNFTSYNQGCTNALEGDLVIAGADITDLSPLSGITSVGGNLDITSNTALTSLVGLDNITSVGESLIIRDNNSLNNLNGLNALTAIGGYLQIENNDALTTISGLQNIQPSSINSPFTSIDDILIIGNSQLTQCSMTSICGALLLPNTTTTIQNNGGNGCNSQQEIEDVCNGACPTDIVLNRQSDVDNFATNYPDCIPRVSGNLTIRGSLITDLSPLSSLTIIGGFLQIENTGLTNLNGLHNLTSINGYLQISDNDVLTNIDALSNIDGASISHSSILGVDITITNNGALTECAITSICETLDLPNILTNIQNNGGTGCNSQQEIEDVCNCNSPSTDYDALVALYNSTNGQNWTNNSGWLTNCDPCNNWSGVICDANDRVTILSLSNNNLVGEIPSELKDLDQLTELYLFDNSIGGEIPPSLGILTNLTALYLRENNLNGAIPEELGNLTLLTDLDLSKNNFEDAIPNSFANLTNLTTFNVSSNQLSGCYDTALKEGNSILCNFDNSFVSDDNTFDAPWEDFCANNSGACTVLNINNVETEKTSIHPNPAKDIIYIQGFEAKKAIVYNILGKKVREEILEEDSLNISQLTSGIYILQLVNKNKEQRKIRLLKK